MKRLAIGLIAAGFLAVSGAALAVDGGSGGDAHNATEAKGTCAKCHIPHGGKGDKIWAQDIVGVAAFTGVHQLCNSCHYTGNTYTASSGIPNVFTLNAYQNHSMLHWANTTGPGITIPVGFVLNVLDTDTIWTVPDPDDSSVSGPGQGFYCGTCHNPHKQPLLPTATTDGQGDYLRSVDTVNSIALFGSSGARVGACTQCHTAIFSGTVAQGHHGNCMICHSPHKGLTLAAQNAAIAEKIIITPLPGNAFTATPNVDGFAAGYAADLAAICYSCHKGTSAQGGLLTTLDTQITTTNEHHPMGTDALLTGTTHAPGYTIGAPGTFTCSSCHEVHNGTQDFYLRPTTGTYIGVASDDGDYCTNVCHNNKSVASLGTADGDAHLEQTLAGSPTGRAECFMCHFIHDGIPRGAGARGDINALMRVEPVNFAASATYDDFDVSDYEDICYGCHSDPVITKGVGTVGATLQSMTAFFTHKFTQAPTPTVAVNMGATYPLASATTTGGVEYGAIAGQLYCGTCHDVHRQNATDAQGQMFRKANNSGTNRSVMCVDCHGAAGMATGRTHPTYLNAGYDTDLPSFPKTAAAIPAGFGSGGDGVQGGRTGSSVPGSSTSPTGQMSCETCHNFHTANTDKWGSDTDSATPGNKGKLLVLDNMATATGSDMCRACHGTGY